MSAWLSKRTLGIFLHIYPRVTYCYPETPLNDGSYRGYGTETHHLLAGLAWRTVGSGIHHT